MDSNTVILVTTLVVTVSNLMLNIFARVKSCDCSWKGCDCVNSDNANNGTVMNIPIPNEPVVMNPTGAQLPSSSTATTTQNLPHIEIEINKQ